jgi:hypothetical protein
MKSGWLVRRETWALSVMGLRVAPYTEFRTYWFRWMAALAAWSVRGITPGPVTLITRAQILGRVRLKQGKK